MKESGVNVTWFSQLEGQLDIPEAAVLLSEDTNKTMEGGKTYHLDVAQSSLPLISTDFITDKFGNLTGFKKLQFYQGDYLLEYDMDRGGFEDRARLARIKKIEESGFKDVSRGSPIWTSMQSKSLGALDWNDMIFSYVTGEVHVNGFKKGPVTAKTVSTNPLINARRS